MARNRTPKPIRPNIKALALKRIGKISQIIGMLTRVKGLDLSTLKSAVTDAKRQVESLAKTGTNGDGPSATDIDLDLM